MKKNLIPLLILLVAPALLSAQKTSGLEKDIEAIKSNIEKFSSFVMAGNYEAIATAYTEDAKIFVAGRDIIEGRENIKKYWTPTGTSRTTYHKIYPEEISVLGDTAYDFGRYEGTTMRANGEENKWKGKYIIIWKKIDGDWKIYADIWNRTE